MGSPGFLKALKRAQWDSFRDVDAHTQRDFQASFRRKTLTIRFKLQDKVKEDLRRNSS